MSTAGVNPLRFISPQYRRKPPYRVILARGNNVKAFHIRPRLAAAAAIAAGVFAVLYFAATGYLVFRDDLLAASFARTARLQQAYEDRITSLRSDIDRLTSRQLLNQEAFDQRLDELLGRQADLDARQDTIASLSQAARSAGLLPDEPPVPRPRPTDEPDTVTTGSIAPDNAPVGLAAVELRTGTVADPLPASAHATQIAAVESSIDTLAHDQVAYIEDIATAVAERSAKIADVLKRLGVKPKVEETADSDVGGPFVPVDEDADPEVFRENVDSITGQIEQFAELRQTAEQLPLGKPIPSAAITSGFGPRMDPFLHRPAMHTGIDFRIEPGYPVPATAAGTVISAQYAGGYGNMVEIDHGQGVTTRYAHLSSILVKKGDHVDEGTIVGRAGSTGRSTGPHLHYEVRVNGRAIDPMIYIRAGTELSALL
jgi:murein DD-endopeptidase MepM/ murein hydrolase activator NlpD